MNFEQLRQLDVIDREGSISAAAKALYVSQPTVTRSIQRLEQELGQKLLIRNRTRAELTDAGKIALEYARSILMEERKMLEVFDDLSKSQMMLKVVSCAPAPAWRLTSFLIDQFPGMLLDPVFLDEEIALRRLLTHTADMAITCGNQQVPNTISVPLMVEHLFILAPKGHPLTKRESLTFDELEGETFLIDSSSVYWNALMRRKVPSASFMVQSDRDVLNELVRTTDYLTFANDTPQFADRQIGRVRIPLTDAEMTVTYYLQCLADGPSRALEIAERAQELIQV